MPTFKTGDKIQTEIRDELTVVKFLAAGGQGEVYKVNLAGKEYALKWYLPSYLNKLKPNYEPFHRNLIENVRRGSPAQQFLWPQVMTVEQSNSFGYIMDLRTPEYVEYKDYILGNNFFKKWETLINAALNITQGFEILHKRGYSYQDLNEGSFFIDPENGKVLICDNDNVAPSEQNLGVKGMARYMAPEVVTNKQFPDTETDRFSLAVILFRLFYIDHPLEGKFTLEKCPIMTDKNGAMIYGSHAQFCLDPKNDSNRPSPIVHPNVIERCRIFPSALQEVFVKAFTDGMHERGKRITEEQWRKALVKTRDMLIINNGKEQFVEASNTNNLPPCCRRLRVKDNLVALMPGTKIYAAHTEKSSNEFAKMTGFVGASKSNPNVLGLCNKSENVWYYTAPNGQSRPVAPGEPVPLVPGIEIQFGGNVVGKVL